MQRFISNFIPINEFLDRVTRTSCLTWPSWG